MSNVFPVTVAPPLETLCLQLSTSLDQYQPPHDAEDWRFPWDMLPCQICIIWFTHVFPVTVAPPLETLLTRFRKLQPSPLEVGDHLILIPLLRRNRW